MKAEASKCLGGEQQFRQCTYANARRRPQTTVSAIALGTDNPYAKPITVPEVGHCLLWL